MLKISQIYRQYFRKFNKTFIDRDAVYSVCPWYFIFSTICFNNLKHENRKAFFLWFILWKFGLVEKSNRKEEEGD